MGSYYKTDDHGVNVKFSAKSISDDGSVTLTPQEFYGLIRSGGSVPGQKNVTLSATEFSGLMESGGWGHAE